MSAVASGAIAWIVSIAPPNSAMNVSLSTS
jgi:hypothetical protein